VKSSKLSAGWSESGVVIPDDFSHHEHLAELLQPDGWREVLEAFGGTLNVAVALTDLKGRQLGECHNPQATWRLACPAQRDIEIGCKFCLVPVSPCTAVADAVRTEEVVLAVDRAGFAHVAVPVLLRGKPVAALIAGQVLTRYPEPLGLERVALELGISSQILWHQAIQEVPHSVPTLQTYGQLLLLLGQAFVSQRYALILHRTLLVANRDVSRSLQEKEVMFTELQHRVKNNLQIVSSMLNMQIAGLSTVEDAKALQILEASQQRVLAMAHIQELLYGTERIGQLDLAAYIKDVASMAISSLHNSALSICCRYSLEAVPLSLRQAIPCGLIVNELITNVFKYAYPLKATGDVFIGVKPVPENGILITVADSGVGLPPGFDWQGAHSVGMRIIRILSKQIGATITLDAQQGTSFTLQFPKDVPLPRI